MKIPGLILGTFLLLTSAGNVHAASFDCSKATSEVEKLICNDDQLSKLDERLSETYKDLLRRSARDPADLKREQMKWLREVRDLCTDSTSLTKEYLNRLEMLEEILESGDPSFLLRCEKSLQRLTIVNSSLIDSGIVRARNRLPGDMIVEPYKLIEVYEIEDEAYAKPLKKAHYRCTLGTADCRVSIAPHILGSRISGMCGAYPPSISVTITRNGKRLVPITFQRYCADENILDAIRIDESAKSVTLFSGLAFLEWHIEKEFPLDALPEDWYSAFFDKWPSGNPLADLRHGIRTHDFALTAQALDSGADPNFPTPDSDSVLCDVFHGRIHARSESMSKLATFDRETDRLLDMLLARGASPTISSEYGTTAVDCAATSDAPARTVRMLLDAGWPKNYQYRLYAGAEIGDPEIVREALDHGADPNVTTRGGRPLVSAITRARMHAYEGRVEQRDQTIATLELLLKHGATVDEGKPRKGGGDIVRTYTGGTLPTMRPIFELLIRYASPTARSNSLQFLKPGASSKNSARPEMLDWLLRRLEKEEQNSEGNGK